MLPAHSPGPHTPAGPFAACSTTTCPKSARSDSTYGPSTVRGALAGPTVSARDGGAGPCAAFIAAPLQIYGLQPTGAALIASAASGLACCSLTARLTLGVPILGSPPWQKEADEKTLSGSWTSPTPRPPDDPHRGPRCWTASTYLCISRTRIIDCFAAVIVAVVAAAAVVVVVVLSCLFVKGGHLAQTTGQCRRTIAAAGRPKSIQHTYSFVSGGAVQ